MTSSSSPPKIWRGKKPLVAAYTTHPDPEFRKYIIDGIKYGVNIGHSGRYIENNIIVNHNWPSAYKYREAVEASIQKDISKGRKLGPYESAPCPFIASPLGAFEKRRSHGKYRVIHDLSWPPGQSVNEGIVEDCSVKYVTIDVITDIIKSFGQTGVTMSKLDLEDAYRHIFVRPEDRFLLGSVWDYINPDGSVCRKYLLDATLPFGLKSSTKHFNKYADALQYAMLRQGTSTVEHYLDDYFTCGKANSMECEANLAIMSYTCKQLGFSVQPEKLVYPTTVLEYIGIVIDSDVMQLRISDERLVEIMTELYS